MTRPRLSNTVPRASLHVLSRKDVSIMRKKGYTLQEIGDIYEVSRQAVSQMLKRIQSDVDSGAQKAYK